MSYKIDGVIGRVPCVKIDDCEIFDKCEIFVTGEDWCVGDTGGVTVSPIEESGDDARVDDPLGSERM